MKLFTKEVKKIVINECLFHCIIDQTHSNESISFKIYSSKTSFFEVLFTWEGSWHFNPHRPKNCERLIKYAIEHGWDFRHEKKTVKIEQGDFLIDKLGLSV